LVKYNLPIVWGDIKFKHNVTFEIQGEGGLPIVLSNGKVKYVKNMLYVLILEKYFLSLYFFIKQDLMVKCNNKRCLIKYTKENYEKILQGCEMRDCIDLMQKLVVNAHDQSRLYNPLDGVLGVQVDEDMAYIQETSMPHS